MPHWSKQDDHFYPFMLAMYAFSLEETGRYRDAEAAAYQSLAMNKQSPWATHALGHVFEEDVGANEGIKFLTTTRDDWKGSLLSNHISWHLCLYYLDLDNIEALLKEFDDNLIHKATPDNILGLIDASSLLWRLECLGIDTGNRWKQVQEGLMVHFDQRVLLWYDAHLMMSLMHGPADNESAARFILAEQLMKSLQQYSQSSRSFNCKVANVIGIPICQALMAYGKQQFAEAIKPRSQKLTILFENVKKMATAQ